VGVVAYSTAQSPYGFTPDKGRWELIQINKVQGNQTNPASGTWYNLTPTTGVQGAHALKVPAGVWSEVSYRVVVSTTTATLGVAGVPYATLTTTNGSQTDNDYTTRGYVSVGGSTSLQILALLHGSKPQNISVATNFYINVFVDNASQTNLNTFSGNTPTIIKAVPAGI
jgi:hypothetical protein